MKRPKKNTWLIALMVISQLMLTGLVIQWLRSQYLNEKESFRKEIGQQFRESVNQALDSMLVKHLISPVLKDSTVVWEQLIKINRSDGDSLNKQNKHITAFINSPGDHREARITVSVNDSVKRLHNEIRSSSSVTLPEDIMLRSVKLILRQSGDSASEINQFRHIIRAIPDTVQLKSLFENRLQSSGLNIRPIWLSDPSMKESENNNSSIYFESYLFENPFGVQLNINAILLKRTSGQLLFVIILILVTGSAFFFTYRSMMKMESLNTLRNDFISNISHELKTPLSTVTVALEVLKNYDKMNDRATADEYLDIAIGEMKRLDQLVNKVLSTSRLENQDQYIQLEEEDIVRVTRDVLNSMQARFVRQNAVVNFETENESCVLLIDKLHIHGVLINLIDNSLKYCNEKPEITIRIVENSSSAILSVVDNGPGIPEEYISKVFDKFFRVPDGDLHNIKGYGLGLSFAELVMKQHGGSISVRNIKEGGTVFTLTFPKTKK